MSLIFFFNDTATTEIYTLSLHDALPISMTHPAQEQWMPVCATRDIVPDTGDRKSTRLNSSHQIISYAVFCLKKKKILCLASHASYGTRDPVSSQGITCDSNSYGFLRLVD